MAITLTHPTDSSITWVSGNRGKRPNWVKAILAANPELLPVTVKEEEFVAPTDPNALRFWKWAGLNDDEGRGAAVTHPCIVCAKSGPEAIVTLNKTFKSPVNAVEWATCWKEVSPKDIVGISKVGAYAWNKATLSWDERKILNAVQA